MYSVGSLSKPKPMVRNPRTYSRRSLVYTRVVTLKWPFKADVYANYYGPLRDPRLPSFLPAGLLLQREQGSFRLEKG